MVIGEIFIELKLSNNSIESQDSKNLKKKWFFADYYDTTIILLALISVILVLLGFADLIDLIDLDNPPYSIIDLVIWGVFVVDYSWRFFTTKRKWTNGLIYILYVNIFIVLVGSSILSVVEEKSFSDSLWWALVTVTTVGYGDIVPVSLFGKWLAVLLMLVGIGTIGMLTSSLTNFFVKDNPDEQIKLDKLQDELSSQRILIEKQSEKIEELHRMIQNLIEKR